jgi:PHP family Zn ribbon phosphoesterase
LLNAGEEKLKLLVGEKISKVIMDNREGKLKVQPGYDGVYGKLVLNEISVKQPQKRIDSYT